MASSRKSKPSNTGTFDLAADVAARLKTVVKPGQRLLLGLSGGVDSMVLLDVLARLVKRRRFELECLHVNHQLSPNAARWAQFCRAACRERDVECRVVKVSVSRRDSIERAAREARYTAMHAADADYIVLAHNADDQAETVLLQLLRGAGVKGLAAMPLLKPPKNAAPALDAERSTAPHLPRITPGASILRPLLNVSRAQIERYAQRRKLTWIEDESNLDTQYQRNGLRHEILPLIARRVPGYRATLTRAASHLAEAAALLEDLARIDARDALTTRTLAIPVLRSLSEARARNVLRSMIAAQDWPMPPAERLQEALRQALNARGDAKLRVELGGCALRRQGQLLVLVASRAEAAVRPVVLWRGEPELVLPGGVLSMTPRRGSGIRLGELQAEPVTIRTRAGGERLQCHARQPRRTVKNLLQEARIPPWDRERLPFIYCGETLVCVPGIGVDYRFQAAAGEPAIAPRWRAF
jgi:tRNA(Ile)-lysidine synthase